MKKMCCLLLCMCILLTNISVNAITTDTTKPTLEKVVFPTGEYKPGDQVKFTLVAKDDISGVTQGWLYFVKAGSKNFNDEINVTFLIQQNVTSYSVTIPKNMKAGKYILCRVQLTDAANNRIDITNSNFMTGTDTEYNHFQPFQSGEFTVLETNQDTTPPQVTNVSINKTEFTYPDTLVIEANITDPSGIKYASVNFEGVDRISVNFVCNNGACKVSYPLKNNGGDYKLNSINVTDNADNYVSYMPPWEYNTASSTQILTLPKLTFHVNGVVDKEAPVLENIIFPKTEFTAPSVFKTKVKATDAISGISSIQLNIYNVETNKQNGICNSEASKEGDYYVVNCRLDQYSPLGVYKVRTAILTDNANNTSIYTIENIADTNYLPLGNYTFKVIEEEKTDLTVGTGTENIIDKINKTENNAVIAIDSTKNGIVKKEVFDAIKGTDRKIKIEANGIEWIFRGKDITKETKDIDVSINFFPIKMNAQNAMMSDFGEPTNAVAVNFKSNGVLPGKALVRVKADYTFRDMIGVKDLYVYFYNDNVEGLEVVASKIDMTSDGFYEFYIEHNSTYLLTSKKASRIVKDSSKINVQYNKEEIKKEEITKVDGIVYEDEETAPTIKESKNNNLPVNLIIIASLAAVVLVVAIVMIFLYKKQRKDENFGTWIKNKIDKKNKS